MKKDWTRDSIHSFITTSLLACYRKNMNNLTVLLGLWLASCAAVMAMPGHLCSMEQMSRDGPVQYIENECGSCSADLETVYLEDDSAADGAMVEKYKMTFCLDKDTEFVDVETPLVSEARTKVSG